MAGRAYAFGAFRLDVAAHELTRDGQPVALPAKAFDTLALLVEHHERVVPKDELLRSVWPDTFVTEDSLTQNISALRRALGDETAHPKYIGTIARRGYRFVAPIVELPAGADPTVATGEQRSSTAGTGARARRTVAAWIVGATLVVLAVVALVRARRTPAAASSLGPLRFTQDLPAGTTLASGGIVSPDSRYLAFVAQDENSGETQLWIRALDSAEARPLPGTDGASRPFWSPDSQAIGFFAESRVKRIGLSDAPPQTLAPTIVARPAGGTWNDSGTILYADSGSLYAVRDSGGEPAVVRAPDAEAQDVALAMPQFLPDGRHYLYQALNADGERAGTWVGSLDSSGSTRLLDGGDSSVTYVPPGYLLSVREHVLTAQRFDTNRLALAGQPWPVSGGVSDNPLISGSAAGVLAFGGGLTAERLAWFDQSGRRGDVVQAPTVLHNLSLSPDERRLIGSSAESDQGGLWMIDLDSGVPTRLIPDAGPAVWSPDGQRLAFTAPRTPGVTGVYVRALAGGGDQLLFATAEPKFLNDWSRDGKYLVYVRADLKTSNDLWVLPLQGERKPYPLVATGANEIQAQVSPDGKRVAYASDESGSWEVYVQTFPTPGAKRRISIAGGTEPQWRRDGRALYYLGLDHTMMAVDVTGANGFDVGRPHPLFRAPVLGSLADYRSYYAVSADGRRFLVDSVATGSTEEPITIMVNWARRNSR